MHDCTQCGCACYCHGDIDDCQVETIEYSDMHCEGCGCGEDVFEFAGPDDEEDYCGPVAQADNSNEEYELWLMSQHLGALL